MEHIQDIRLSHSLDGPTCWVLNRRAVQPIYGCWRLGTNATTNRAMLNSIGRTKLGGWAIDTERDCLNGNNAGAHLATDCYWYSIGYPELCYSCLYKIGITPDWDNANAGMLSMGVQNNIKNIEEEIMMSDLLGTMWWSVLCVIAGMVLGTYLRPWIMEKLGK